MNKKIEYSENCPNCKVPVGNYHIRTCPTDECPECGRSFHMCECSGNLCHRLALKWEGVRKDIAACKEYGFYANEICEVWIPCDPEDTGATEDWRYVSYLCKWSPGSRKWVKRDRPLPLSDFLLREAAACMEKALYDVEYRLRSLVRELGEEELEEVIEYLTVKLNQLKKFILKHHPEGQKIINSI